MGKSKKNAPSAGEELEQQVEEAETDVTEERARRRDSEAGDSLTPSREAQRQAQEPGPSADSG
ncbi:hypothetical protein H181DRAFT_01175 [Streptomyces sp. WMMB 714]|jgi:hypothetical protein|uniref:hypothetical protein n=1 Tax=Streptomyces sp. WMMB 714 TaxID=1286822 RepID=UPI0005F7F666|nr:hypothetical protein [Streptomyces sp. WMMB 714]SCK17470.1 hypothetical protein H181DRAFT_01175 [Streptomyces sp. WMMB 714]